MLRLTLSGLTLRAAQSAVSLLNVVILARALGPVGRGEYFLFVAAVALLARLIDLGMSPSAVVFASRYPDALRAVHWRLLALLGAFWTIGGLLALTVVLVAGQSLSELPRERLVLAWMVVPFAAYEQLWVHLMVGLGRILPMNALQLSAGIATLALNLGVVVAMSGGVAAAVGIYSAVLLIKTAPMLITLMSTLGARVQQAPTPSVRELMAFGLRSYPNAIAALAWTRLPAFVLDAFKGAGAVGVFSVGQQVLEQLILPLQATQDAIYRSIASDARARATAAMNRYLRLGLWGMLPLAAASALLAPWLVPLVFGSDFEGSVLVLQILLISLLASVVPALLSPYFFGQLQRPGLASGIAWIRVAMALVLAVGLVPEHGALGLAASLAAADVCSTLVILALYGRIAHTSVSEAVLLRSSDFGNLWHRIRHSGAN